MHARVQVHTKLPCWKNLQWCDYRAQQDWCTGPTKEVTTTITKQAVRSCRDPLGTQWLLQNPNPKKNLLGISVCHSSSCLAKELCEKEQSRTDLLVQNEIQIKSSVAGRTTILSLSTLSITGECTNCQEDTLEAKSQDALICNGHYIQRGGEKEISSSKAPLLHRFLHKSHSMTFKRYRCILYSLKLHLQQLSTGIARLSPLFPLHFCFLVSDFKMHNTVFHFFFFKGTWPSVSLAALRKQHHCLARAGAASSQILLCHRLQKI